MNKSQRARLMKLLNSMNATAVDRIQMEEFIEEVASDAYIEGVHAGAERQREADEEDREEVRLASFFPFRVGG